MCSCTPDAESTATGSDSDAVWCPLSASLELATDNYVSSAIYVDASANGVIKFENDDVEAAFYAHAERGPETVAVECQGVANLADAYIANFTATTTARESVNNLWDVQINWSWEHEILSYKSYGAGIAWASISGSSEEVLDVVNSGYRSEEVSQISKIPLPERELSGGWDSPFAVRKVVGESGEAPSWNVSCGLIPNIAMSQAIALLSTAYCDNFLTRLQNETGLANEQNRR